MLKIAVSFSCSLGFYIKKHICQNFHFFNTSFYNWKKDISFTSIWRYILFIILYFRFLLGQRLKAFILYVLLKMYVQLWSIHSKNLCKYNKAFYYSFQFLKFSFFKKFLISLTKKKIIHIMNELFFLFFLFLVCFFFMI